MSLMIWYILKESRSRQAPHTNDCEQQNAANQIYDPNIDLDTVENQRQRKDVADHQVHGAIEPIRTVETLNTRAAQNAIDRHKKRHPSPVKDRQLLHLERRTGSERELQNVGDLLSLTVTNLEVALVKSHRVLPKALEVPAVLRQREIEEAKEEEGLLEVTTIDLAQEETRQREVDQLHQVLIASKSRDHDNQLLLLVQIASKSNPKRWLDEDSMVSMDIPTIIPWQLPFR